MWFIWGLLGCSQPLKRESHCLMRIGTKNKNNAAVSLEPAVLPLMADVQVRDAVAENA